MRIKHLDEVGESYFKHMLCALTIAAICQLCVLAQVIHAVFPFIHPPKRLSVDSIAVFLISKSPSYRKQLLD